MIAVILLALILGPVIIPIVVAVWVAEDAYRMKAWRKRRDAAAMRLYTQGWDKRTKDWRSNGRK